MTIYLVLPLMVIGTAFALLAAVALVRMPDLFTRMHGATKCATLGVGCIILAVAILFQSTETSAHALLITAFLFLTAPIAAHMIGRAGHRLNTPRWHSTIVDEYFESQKTHD